MSTSEKVLKPGDTIGILGGGQLGRMIAQAATRLGLKSHIYCPDADSPAFDCAAETTIAAYDDLEALEKFAASVSVVTYEFENVPGETADFLEARCTVRPGPLALTVSQDRLAEKTFLREKAGVAVAGFYAVDTDTDLKTALSFFDGQGVLKTRRFGYDGKGQAMIRSEEDEANALEVIGDQPAILEALIPFDKEISVLVARGVDGDIRCYDPAENIHTNHILKTSTVPADIPREVATAALEMAAQIAAGLEYVGVMGVEMFAVANEEEGYDLLVNEIAPRVHNSGHWTEDACPVSQFEQHVRAIAGWPLGNPGRTSDVVMENLIGHDADAWQSILSEPNARLTLYGKAETRDGRKMGHVNRLTALTP
ncbi:5-(carboxyamino)imidazole ribonucleotide synthase [Pseudovibrio sp. SPO723]|uniref:5-(carboxyamino)imidazole ribonucleotide synthase n=1 Tax=Nesiotobacter zosterae TaxID=392721 RepID=UPI0029C489F2|nr:5-(carboxyamino)imidazole ribonucleotide synthase [Pseudovibrio sp. SPO723]MDX5595454.1 5-(carboxyamino)imidazole ribonucleotide synthase [Pseudovibrio sp. SPO723]